MNKNFESQDFSATAPALRKLISDPVLALIPKSISPNALTLFGGGAASITAFLFWNQTTYLNPETASGQFCFYLGAFCLAVYAVCDQLDGLQARRLQRGGPSGDFLDHWVDALLANVIPIGLMLFAGVNFLLILFMTNFIALTFWANNWETKHEFKRKLPFIGGLEFIWFGVAVLMVSAFFGMSFWDRVFLGFEYRDWGTFMVFAALAASFLRNLYHARQRAMELLTPVVSFLPVTLWLAWGSISNSLQEYELYAGLALIGLMGVKHTGDQMRQLWLGTKISAIEWIFVLPGALLLMLLIFPLKLEGPITAEFAVLVLFFALAVWMLCWQSVNTFTLLSGSQYQKRKRIMVDMSATLLHHGHIRLLKQAKELGHVVVGLTSDQDLKRVKQLDTELSFDQRKEILLAIEYVDEVVETPWLLTNETLDAHQIDLLVHGDDNQNNISPDKLVLFPRTEGISSEDIRERAKDNLIGRKMELEEA